jgi:hypothetical protein
MRHQVAIAQTRGERGSAHAISALRQVAVALIAGLVLADE